MADNNDPLIINGNGKTVVVISLKDYNSMDETEYLMSSEANRKMMYKAKDEIEKGNLTSLTINELDKMIGHD